MDTVSNYQLEQEEQVSQTHKYASLILLNSCIEFRIYSIFIVLNFWLSLKYNKDGVFFLHFVLEGKTQI